MNSPKRILIAGIGNIFFGDDAFGCEVAQRLSRQEWPVAVHVRDFGIRGIDLAYALAEPFDQVILIDAVPRGGEPGTLYVIQPDTPDPTTRSPEPQLLWDPHTMDPVKVLRHAQSMGAKIDNVFIVGCEPTPLTADDEMQSALTAPVEQAVDEAVQLVKSLIAQIQNGEICNYQNPAPPLQLTAPSPEMQNQETAP